MTVSIAGRTIRRIGVALMLSAALAVFAGCSEEDDNGQGPIVPGEDTSDTESPVDGYADAPDSDEQPETCTGDSCEGNGDGDGCQGDGCDGPITQCDEPIEGGLLKAGESLNIDSDLPPDAPDRLSTSCGSDDEGPERVVRFTSDANLQVTIQTSTGDSLNVVTEARRGWCSPSEAPGGTNNLSCQSTDNSFFAPENSTWYVVAERSAGIGGNLDLTIQGESACEFGGVNDTTCSEDTFKQCVRTGQGDISPEESSCPTSCGGATCKGETCQHPIVIGSSGATISGSLKAFTDKYQLAKNNSSCPVDGIEVEGAGPDLIFKAESMSPGETLQVDTSPAEQTFYSYISKECPGGAMPVTCRKTFGDDGQFQVPNDGGGDYYIVIDRAAISGSSSFTFDFTRQAP